MKPSALCIPDKNSTNPSYVPKPITVFAKYLTYDSTGILEEHIVHKLHFKKHDPWAALLAKRETYPANQSRTFELMALDFYLTTDSQIYLDYSLEKV